MLCHHSLISPLGALFLTATEDGVCRVSWEVSEEGSINGRVSSLLQEAARQMGEYFDGRRRKFELPLDLSEVRVFQRDVLTTLLEVPYGEVVTYGELATLSGHPGAARAVGGAMRGNPLPIIIPCHRVLPSAGGLGGFGGRPDLKRRLLELEGCSEDSVSRVLKRK
jgi:methylated-DNA-[protein]-cysteine S-methyltransferase